jgi:hypothetical protein
MIKRFCDGCGTELILASGGTCLAYTLKIEPLGDYNEKVYHGDLCWECRSEIKIFISEQCKHHLLTKIDHAFGDLEI